MAGPTLGKGHRRRLAVVAGVCAVTLLFGARLVDVQLVQAATLNAQAEGKRSVPITLASTRGRILDRNGNVLAETVLRYRLVVDQTLVGDAAVRVGDGDIEHWTVDQIADHIAQVSGTSVDDVRAALTGTQRYSIVAKDLTVEQFDALRGLEISWASFESVPKRIYPNGAVAGNIIGFVGSDQTPQAGIETMEQSCLAGQDGEETYERGANGVRIPGTTVTEQPVVDGGDVTLTIDRDLQWYAQQKVAERQQELKADWITATVLDVKSGDIIAAAESPSVDPNDVTASAAADRGSRVFQASYEPGSTIKSITAAVGLESGAITPTSQFTAPYSMVVPGTNVTVSDAFEHNPLRLTPTGILMYSSNTGIMQVGEKEDDRTRYNALKAFGLGAATGIGFPGEASGILRDPDQWDKVTRYTTMFGQGLTATPIQVASIYQAIANDGARIAPRLVSSCTSSDGTVAATPQAASQQVVSQQTATTLQGMLQPLFTEHYGKTAAIAGYMLAGKTGTSQIAGPNGAYLEDQYATSVAAFAPADDPRYLVTITIFKPQTEKTSANTMTLFHDIMNQVLIQNKVPVSSGQPADDPVTW